jgi:hypothetical protein
MKNTNHLHGNHRYLLIAAVCFVALLLTLGFTNTFGESPEPSSTSQEMLRLGERMYRDGILPSGKPILTLIKGESSVPGTTYVCVSCHLRSGLGAMDENVYTPPTSGRKLFQPRYVIYKGVVHDKDFSVPPLRPAYTDETLTVVIRNGKDPTGRVLNEVMPRYLLEDRDALILVNYLKSLSSQFSPGVTDTTLRFATVLTDDTTSEERDAMLSSLESYFKMQNKQVSALKTPRLSRSNLMAEKMLGSRDLIERSISLSPWLLKGPSDTWRGQLEKYNSKEPVFALLGGITNGDWKPIHQFSEDNRIPCLFPNTDFPVVSDTDWYTLYLSKGYYQEGEGAAHYLNSKDVLIKGKPIVQIVRASREGQALSVGFQRTWRDLGHEDPMTITLPPGKTLSAGLLMQLLSKNEPAVLIIWDDSKALPALESLSNKVNKPEMVFVSSGYLGKSIWTLKENIRDFTYITYPFAFSPYTPNEAMGKQKPRADLKMTLVQADIPLKDNRQKITNLTNAMTQLLTLILMDMKGNYYRDNFFDVVGTMMDQQYPLYGRVSFGPGQRYASRGCYIVQLSNGDKPKLIKKSDWEIY